jgi:hypothetical protein
MAILTKDSSTIIAVSSHLQSVKQKGLTVIQDAQKLGLEGYKLTKDILDAYPPLKVINSNDWHFLYL